MLLGSAGKLWAVMAQAASSIETFDRAEPMP